MGLFGSSDVVPWWFTSIALPCCVMLGSSCTVKAVQRANEGPDAEFYFFSCKKPPASETTLENYRQGPDRISKYLVLLDNKGRLHSLIAI